MCCANRCHDAAYPNHEVIKRMAGAEKDGLVPAVLLPKCPRCGGDMKIYMAADQTFFRSVSWKRKQAEYQAFVRKCHNRKLQIVEFGVGWRNQLIKAPLMQLAAVEPYATYVTFNKGEIYIPQEIVAKSIGVDGDIADAISKLCAE